MDYSAPQHVKDDFEELDQLFTDVIDLIDKCFYAFNNMPNQPIGDGTGCKTYDLASEIEAMLERLGK